MSENTEPIIKITDADIIGGDHVVIHGANMEVYPGDFIYIVGKVGTGKTSIFRTIIAENRPAKGSVQVCGYKIEDIKQKEVPFLRRKLGVIFQDFQLLMDRNVHDNLDFVLRATGWKDKDEIEKRIAEVLENVGMQTKASKMPHQLSGGEQQRIAIARSILNEPAVILADEPTGHLDNETADEIMDLLSGINKNLGTAIVMVTHNLNIFDSYPGRALLCSKETIVEI